MNHNRAENLTITKKYQVWCFQADGKSELSVKKIHYELNKFFDYLGSMNLKTISIKVIISYKEDLKSKCNSKATYCCNITSLWARSV